MHHLAFNLVLAAAASVAAADPNDWVNVNYVLNQAGSRGSSNTADARKGIVNSAGSSAKSGPWTVVNKGSVSPPSGDPQDYLSWAPYHWPNCNWCEKGTNHLSNPGGGDPGDDDSGDSPGNDGSDDDSGDGPNSATDGSDQYDDGGGDSNSEHEALIMLQYDYSSAFSRRRRDIFGSHRRMRKLRHRASDEEQTGTLATLQDNLPTGESSGLPLSIISVSTVPTPTATMPDLGLPTTSTSSSIGTIMGTPAPAEAPAKTTTPASKCTPSPTKSLAPTATWTTCPYQVHDGKVNPDVPTLPDSPAAVSMSQSVLYNALAHVLSSSKTSSSSSYSSNAVSFIDAFFLNAKTSMNPNMNFGQLVRGPGPDHQVGTFTGVLDMRGIVKVANAIQVLKAAGNPDWSAARDKEMTAWMTQYSQWLSNSALGKQVASKGNNHYTFYVNQLAATKIFLGDTEGAMSDLQSYFTHQFLDQIAASGEQPFEAVRTRPFHYRCFNLEAMITIAKMADQLGMNLWNARSKYGATIQTALDYTMALDPGKEDVSDIFPHVAAVAAAYGDPQGKYAAFLQKHVADYQSESFWFYDQTASLPNSPAAAGSGSHKRDGLSSAAVPGEAGAGMTNVEAEVVDAVETAQRIPFECPAVFDYTLWVELDDDIYVSCDEVRPFYEIVWPVATNATRDDFDS